MRSFVLLTLMAYLTFALITAPVDSALAAAQEQPLTPYARVATVPEVKRALDWYARNSLGALLPTSTIALTPRQFEDDSGRSISEQEALGIIAKLGIWKQDALNPGRVIIQHPYRKYVWWPGLPAAGDEFVVSPLEYEIISIDSIKEEKRGSVPIARIEFTWRVKRIAPLLTKLQDIGWEPQDDRSLDEVAKEFASRIGTSERHSVVMDSGEYGYFLPISREPLP